MGKDRINTFERKDVTELVSFVPTHIGKFADEAYVVMKGEDANEN